MNHIKHISFMSIFLQSTCCDTRKNIIVSQQAVSDDNMINTDYIKWISFSKFVPVNSIWTVQRKVMTNPLYCLTKNNSNETSWLTTTLDCSNRMTNNKGKRLKNIYLGYKIETQAITSISSRLTLTEFIEPNATPTLSNISIDDSDLTSGTTIDDHYRKIEISSPQFLNVQGFLSLEIELTTPVNSTIHFYGIHLEFDYNNST